MKDGTGVMDVLNKKVEQMNAEIKRMREVLQAKEAVLDDVLCSINQLPRHPINTVLIQVSVFAICDKREQGIYLDSTTNNF